MTAEYAFLYCSDWGSRDVHCVLVGHWLGIELRAPGALPPNRMPIMVTTAELAVVWMQGFTENAGQRVLLGLVALFSLAALTSNITLARHPHSSS